MIDGDDRRQRRRQWLQAAQHAPKAGDPAQRLPAMQSGQVVEAKVAVAMVPAAMAAMVPEAMGSAAAARP